jgi:hypothetical protein
METKTMASEFTGYLMLKCKNGHTTRIQVGRDYYRKGLDSVRVLVTCGTEGCGLRYYRNTINKALYGRTVKEKACSSKCMGATSGACDCSCGGENHGGGHPMVSAT